MLLKKNHKVKCPNCGSTSEVELWNVADVRVSPELKEEILSGKFNVVKCNKCRTRYYVEVPFVYQDLHKDLLVTVFPESARENEFEIRKNIKEVEKKSDIDTNLKKYVFFGINVFVEFLKNIEK